jgi:hypothetical protein
MWIDARPLMVVAGLAGGVMVGLFDFAFWRGQAVRRPWVAAALLLTGLLGVVAMFVSPALRSLVVVSMLAAAALLIWATNLTFWHLRFSHAVRCALIGLAGLLLIGLIDTSAPRHASPGWFFGPLLLVWALATLIAGERAPGLPAAPTRVPTSDDVEPPAWWTALAAAFAGLSDALQGLPGTLLTTFARSGTLIRGVLVFTAVFVVGALLMLSGIGMLSAPLLALASAMPGSPDAPIGDPAAALAYWLSFGIVPSLLLTLAGLPCWRRIGPA